MWLSFRTSASKEYGTIFCLSANMKTPFPNGRPGLDWMRLFEGQHTNLVTKRKPELLTLARAEGLSENTVNCFYDLYEPVADTQHFKDHPESQLSLDETCLTTDIVCNLVFVRRDSRNAYMISPQSGKTMFTVLFCVSATGVYLPPLTIYKAKSVYPEWRQGGVPGATYACSDSG